MVLKDWPPLRQDGKPLVGKLKASLYQMVYQDVALYLNYFKLTLS